MMSTPKVKIKLNPECKHALLNQTMQIHYSRGRYAPAKKKAFKFFKLLIVSKSFLSCSRRFEVYRIRVDLPCRLYKEIQFSVLNEKDYFKNEWSQYFRLDLEKSKALLRLFRPTYFGIKQGDYLIHRYVKELYEMLRLTDGKIGLFFDEKHIEFCHLRLVDAFSSRVHGLKCSGEMLEDDSLSKLRLGYCEIFNLESIGQLSKVLRHDFRKLKIKVDHAKYLDKKELVLVQESVEDLQVVNISVETMELHCDGLTLDQVKHLAGAVLKFCPSLKSFYLYAAESEKFPEFFDMEFTARQALSQREKIMELKQLLSTPWIKPHIKLKLIISGAADADDFGDPEIYYWYSIHDEEEEEVNVDEFVGWKSGMGGYDFDTTQDDIPREDQFGYNVCSSCFTFEDENCKLELDITNRVYSIHLHI